jgi:tight adherence protein B
LSFIVALFVYILVGFKWYIPLLIVIIPVLLTYFYVTHARSNRISAFEKQLPEALDIIVRSLRAGHPTVAAIGLAARECPDPLGSEFGIAYDEMQHGLDITSSINNMCDRVGMLDLVYVQAAIAVQTQSGGSLSDIMARLSILIKDRFKLRQKVLALTSEGRISGLVLTLMPVAILIVISFITPTYYGDTYFDPLTLKAGVLSISLLIIGHLYIQYLLKFKY